MSTGRAGLVGVTRERARQLVDELVREGAIIRRSRTQRLYEVTFPERADEVEARFLEPTDAVDAMVKAWQELGRAPTVEEYDIWRAGRADFPASATARKLVDRWDCLQLAAWPIVHGRTLPADRARADGGSPPRDQRDRTTRATSASG